MRAIFGVLALLIVLAAVGSLAKKQLQALTGENLTRNASAASQAAEAAGNGGSRGAAYSVPGGMAGATAADPNAFSVPQQSREMQDKARNTAVRALQQGAERNKSADR